jgi:hypothetical protein
MRDHEIELISALVEGRLDDESEARALIESSPELREEYETQKLAHDTLRSLGTVAMSETERAALHRDVWSALRSDSGRAGRRTPWYYRWAPVAAGMFVVAGAVGVLSQTGGPDAAVVAEDALDGAETATTEADPASLYGLASDEDEADELMERPTAEDDTEGTLETDSLEDSVTAFYAAEAAGLRAGEDGETVSQTHRLAGETEPLQRCVDETGLEGFEVFETRFVSEDAGLHNEIAPFIVAIPEDAELATAPMAFVDLESCELVHIDR